MVTTRNILQSRHRENGGGLLRTLRGFMNNFAARRERKAVALLAVTSPHTIARGPRSERRAVSRALELLGRKNPLLVRNWYEGGFPLSDGGRSWLPELLSDARYDQNTMTRRELMRRNRYWEKNSPLMKRALDLSEQYVIGTHMPVVTSLATDATGWCQRAEAVFAEMIESAGVNGESLYAMLCIGHRRKKVDGNVLFMESNRRAKLPLNPRTTIEVSRPCYQMFEGHRIETPFNLWDREGQDIVDGVQYRQQEVRLPDGQMRRQLSKVGYWVKDSPNVFLNNDSFALIPLEGCYYATTAHRVNEPRGVSDFYAVEPTLALLEDLLKLEMRAQEVQSDIALFITNGAGQIIDPKMQGTLGALGIKVSNDVNGKPVVTVDDVKKVQEVYQKIWGGRTAVGRTGDTMTAMAPNRPAEATLNLWEFLINSFCAGARLPRCLMFPKVTKSQGTEIRAEIEAANAAWTGEFNLVWKPLILRVWKYFMGWAVKNDPRVADPPADWDRIEVSPPRSVVVDIGYDSAAKLAETAAGVTNLHDWAQDLGTTKAKLIQHSVDDVFQIKLACAVKAEDPLMKKYGITVDAAEVRNNLAEVAKNLAAQKLAEAQKQSAELQTA